MHGTKIDKRAVSSIEMLGFLYKFHILLLTLYALNEKH